MGISRSPTVVCAYLMAHKSMSPHEALNYVTSRRHIVCPNLGFRRQLDMYAARLRSSRKLRRPHVPIPPPVRVTVTRTSLAAEHFGWIRPSQDVRPPLGQMTRRGSMG